MARATVMVTGNATVDGRPVYMKRDGEWVFAVGDGYVIESPEEAERLLATARGDEYRVCDPYTIEIEVETGSGPRPVSLRETIRASGPTIPFAV